MKLKTLVLIISITHLSTTCLGSNKRDRTPSDCEYIDIDIATPPPPGISKTSPKKRLCAQVLQIKTAGLDSSTPIINTGTTASTSFNSTNLGSDYGTAFFASPDFRSPARAKSAEPTVPRLAITLPSLRLPPPVLSIDTGATPLSETTHFSVSTNAGAGAGSTIKASPRLELALPSLQLPGATPLSATPHFSVLANAAAGAGSAIKATPRLGLALPSLQLPSQPPKATRNPMTPLRIDAAEEAESTIIHKTKTDHCEKSQSPKSATIRLAIHILSSINIEGDKQLMIIRRPITPPLPPQKNPYGFPKTMRSQIVICAGLEDEILKSPELTPAIRDFLASENVLRSDAPAKAAVDKIE